MERTIFDTLMWAYAKFYNPSQHLVLNKVTKIQENGFFPSKGNVSHQNLWPVWMSQGIPMT